MIKKIFTGNFHHFLFPILFTGISFFYVNGCEDLTCLFQGNGFPFAFYNNNFSLSFFFLDVVFWWFVYLILSIIFHLTMKLIHKKNI